MAPKRSIPLEGPPPASSSSEEESFTNEKQQKPYAQLSQNQASKPVPKKSHFTTQQAGPPIALKLMEENPLKTTKHRSKSLASTQVAVKSTAAVKRGSETDRDPKESKRSKKKDSESDGSVDKPEDIKKQLFQRLWSEDDEILVLEGIIDFTENKGVDHAKDMNSFFDFIKSSLHFDFEKHESKGKMGEDKTFSKAHHKKSFDLWKKIWSSEATRIEKYVVHRGLDVFEGPSRRPKVAEERIKLHGAEIEQ
ncbi:hypothetical protein MANES_17G030155v8 [Manihot esculenta]|uniref:Uncharacterized protein n=1 Tax=Manihot esculenta TaxID=3983 RepID=A0ACB7G2V0_MANES|nr:hypothetical protein MANES_17G030155v8 [Manihot esculenta]